MTDTLDYLALARAARGADLALDLLTCPKCVCGCGRPGTWQLDGKAYAHDCGMAYLARYSDCPCGSVCPDCCTRCGGAGCGVCLTWRERR